MREQRAAALRRRLEDWLARQQGSTSTPDQAPLTAEDKARLEALGYVFGD